MDLELDVLLGKSLEHLTGMDKDMIATDDGDRRQKYRHSPKLLAQLSHQAKV